ncbi:MAG: GTP-binding protein [Verrucomicrobia bacterium]|nr:GTP-binding protein [Verrucomicrobiota bacterium]MDA1085692.1 GTP-binding protein [Verrucomicrobiota bacterium]
MVPVHIISGFLGSGKTTLMNHCLRTLPPERRVALVVNDFGTVAIDSRLVERPEYAMKELSSGCVCCTLSGPLVEALASITRDQDPELIVMETTGIAEPAQIAQLFAYDALSSEISLGNIVCVIDSSTFPRMERHFRILRQQVEQSNTLIVNKTDKADAECLEVTRRRVEVLAQPDAITVETTQAQIDPQHLLTSRPNYLPANSRFGHEHSHEFTACTIEGDETYSLARLTACVSDLGTNILRVKGIMRTDQGPRLIQGSVAGLDISSWADEPDKSRLVVIGRDLDTHAIEAAFQACRV